MPRTSIQLRDVQVKKEKEERKRNRTGLHFLPIVASFHCHPSYLFLFPEDTR
jgi:hypothetical protein